MFAEPGDHGLLAQRGDCELGLLCMTIVAQHNIGDFSDGACFICGSIDVVDRYGRGEVMGRDVVQTDILRVDEKPSSAAVDERTGVAPHRGVRRLNFNVDVELGVVAMTNLFGSRRSQLASRIRAILGGGGEGWGTTFTQSNTLVASSH